MGCWWLRGYPLPGIPLHSLIYLVCWAQKGSHQSFISSRLLLSLHKQQKPVGLTRIHVRAEWFSKSNDKKALCLLELLHYFCYAPGRRKQISSLALHPQEKGLCLPSIHGCVSGSHRGGPKLKADDERREGNSREEEASLPVPSAPSRALSLLKLPWMMSEGAVPGTPHTHFNTSRH